MDCNDWIEEWRREGCALLPGFLPREEMERVQEDFVKVFGAPEQHPGADADTGGADAFNPDQFKFFENIPFDCSPALNLLAVHPSLVDAAKRALATESSATTSS